MTDPIRILPGLAIDPAELHYEADRAGGPGGQHVNKSSTRITVYFDVATSPSLSAEQKETLLARLGRRMSKDGVLRVVAQSERSQSANREAATARLIELLAAALHRPRQRRATRPTFGSKQRRIGAKKRRGDTKRSRGRPGDDD